MYFGRNIKASNMNFDIVLVNEEQGELVVNVKYATTIRGLKYQLEIPDCHAGDIVIFNKHRKPLPDNMPIRGMATFFYELPA